MANHYHDTTGVILIGGVTPVIQALYASFELDPGHPGNGEAYVANIGEQTDSSWSTVIESLALLADKMGARMPSGNHPRDAPQELFLTLGRHFQPGHPQDGDAPSDLLHLADQLDFQGMADFESTSIIMAGLRRHSRWNKSSA
jgi:hypothetical protein